MTYEPKNADPEEVARRQVAAPGVKLAPPATWIVNEQDELVYYKMQNMSFARKARNRLGELIFPPLRETKTIPPTITLQPSRPRPKLFSSSTRA